MPTVLPYERLSVRGQTARLRRLAANALQQWALADPQLNLVQHSENTTFRIRCQPTHAENADSGPFLPNQYLLRIHGLGRYKEGAAAQRAVDSELHWLAALRQAGNLSVPAPVTSATGEFAIVAHAPGVPQARVCSLLRWLPGKCVAGSPRPVYFYRLGGLMATLHTHAQRWSPPPSFRRLRWDWAAFFGDGLGFAGLSAAETWALLPPALHDRLAAVGEQAALAMRNFGEDSEVWGLIHADLHLDNVLFYGGEAQPIDFDDCGFGYWLYDMAVALWEQRMTPTYPAIQQAFFEGYASRRPLPLAQLAYLDLFIAVREAAFGLWACAMAQQHATFRIHLAEEMARMRTSIDTLLPALAGKRAR